MCQALFKVPYIINYLIFQQCYEESTIIAPIFTDDETEAHRG